jgi:hypothetical protein
MSTLEDILGNVYDPSQGGDEKKYTPHTLGITKMEVVKASELGIGDAETSVLVFHVKEFDETNEVFTIRQFLRKTKTGKYVTPLAKGHSYNDTYYPNGQAYDLFEAICASNPAKEEELRKLPLSDSKKFVGHKFTMDARVATSSKDGSDYLYLATDWQLTKDKRDAESYAEKKKQEESMIDGALTDEKSMAGFAKDVAKTEEDDLPF